MSLKPKTTDSSVKEEKRGTPHFHAFTVQSWRSSHSKHDRKNPLLLSTQKRGTETTCMSEQLVLTLPSKEWLYTSPMCWGSTWVSGHTGRKMAISEKPLKQRKRNSECGTEALSHRAVGKRGRTEEDGLIQNQEPIKELQIPPFPSSWNIPLIRCLQWFLLLSIASSHIKKNKHTQSEKPNSLKETEQVWKLKSMRCVRVKPVI